MTDKDVVHDFSECPEVIVILSDPAERITVGEAMVALDGQLRVSVEDVIQRQRRRRLFWERMCEVLVVIACGVVIWRLIN